MWLPPSRGLICDSTDSPLHRSFGGAKHGSKVKKQHRDTPVHTSTAHLQNKKTQHRKKTKKNGKRRPQCRTNTPPHSFKHRFPKAATTTTIFQPKLSYYIASSPTEATHATPNLPAATIAPDLLARRHRTRGSKPNAVSDGAYRRPRRNGRGRSHQILHPGDVDSWGPRRGCAGGRGHSGRRQHLLLLELQGDHGVPLLCWNNGSWGSECGGRGLLVDSRADIDIIFIVVIVLAVTAAFRYLPGHSGSRYSRRSCADRDLRFPHPPSVRNANSSSNAIRRRGTPAPLGPRLYPDHITRNRSSPVSSVMRRRCTSGWH